MRFAHSVSSATMRKPSLGIGHYVKQSARLSLGVGVCRSQRDGRERLGMLSREAVPVRSVRKKASATA